MIMHYTTYVITFFGSFVGPYFKGLRFSLLGLSLMFVPETLKVNIHPVTAKAIQRQIMVTAFTILGVTNSH